MKNDFFFVSKSHFLGICTRWRLRYASPVFFSNTKWLKDLWNSCRVLRHLILNRKVGAHPRRDRGTRESCGLAPPGSWAAPPGKKSLFTYLAAERLSNARPERNRPEHMSTVICLPFNHLNKTVFVRSVFNEVHENSTEVWKWEMYRLVEECDARPSLAPPLSVLEDFFELLKGIWKRTCRDASHQIWINLGNNFLFSRLGFFSLLWWTHSAHVKFSQFVESNSRRKKEDLYSLMGSALETLRLFERDCMNAFLDGEEKKHNDSIDQRIRSLEEK